MSMLNFKDNYICALDIGSSKIAAVLIKIQGKRISHIFFETTPSKGVKRGMIVDSIGLVGVLTKVMKSLKEKSGLNLKSVYANISGQDITSRHSRAVIPLAERGNKIITLSDVHKVNEQARILASSLEEEIIHQIPFGYTIDSRINIANPLGLYSHRLESDLYIVCVKLSLVQSLLRAINQAGFDIKGLFFSGIATSRAVLNKGLLKGANIFCDIGSDITELLFIKDGLIRDMEILALGGDDLTAELQDALKIPFDLAEDVKRSYGIIGDYVQIDENKEILIKKSDIYKPIKQKLVLEILTSKAKAMCQEIKGAVDRKSGFNEVNNFITVGRTVLLEGFLETMENTLGVSVKLGRITEPLALGHYAQDLVSFINQDDALSGQKYLNYAVSLAMICEALRSTREELVSASLSSQGLISKAVARCKEVCEEYF